jgi:benzil reductase ((S)-benzoin forming)
MNDIIITGGSKGIGRALFEYLSKDKENRLYLIARNFNENEFKNANTFKFDLSDTKNIKNLIKKIFTNIDLATSKKVVLINNAGVLNPIKFSGNDEDIDIENNISVNLIAPMILTSNFIKKLKHFNNEKKIINISSGAGKHPYAGWSCYTTSKAGIDMFTKSVALEQNMIENGVKIVSFAPGIVETSMQEEIRASNQKDFPLIDKFLEIKKQNIALKPEFVAKSISNLIDNDFNSGDILDIRF